MTLKAFAHHDDATHTVSEQVERGAARQTAHRWLRKHPMGAVEVHRPGQAMRRWLGDDAALAVGRENIERWETAR